MTVHECIAAWDRGVMYSYIIYKRSRIVVILQTYYEYTHVHVQCESCST